MKNLDIDFFQMMSEGPTMGLYLGGTHRRMTLLIGKRAERHTFICVSPRTNGMQLIACFDLIS